MPLNFLVIELHGDKKRGGGDALRIFFALGLQFGFFRDVLNKLSFITYCPTCSFLLFLSCMGFNLLKHTLTAILVVFLKKERERDKCMYQSTFHSEVTHRVIFEGKN